MMSGCILRSGNPLPLGRGAVKDGHERPQDPRFTGSVQDTRTKFHDSPDSMYGLGVNGRVLGAP